MAFFSKKAIKATIIRHPYAVCKDARKGPRKRRGYAAYYPFAPQAPQKAPQSPLVMLAQQTPSFSTVFKSRFPIQGRLSPRLPDDTHRTFDPQ
jgi:hypothetical protein